MNLSEGSSGRMSMSELDQFVELSEVLMRTRELIEESQPGTDLETN
jgi:hypothetical protein